MPNALPTAHSTQVSSVIYHVFPRVEISPTFATTTSIFIPSLFIRCSYELFYETIDDVESVKYRTDYNNIVRVRRARF